MATTAEQLYEGNDGFADATLAWVRDAVAAQEPILVAGVIAGAVLDSKPGPAGHRGVGGLRHRCTQGQPPHRNDAATPAHADRRMSNTSYA
jgi:hypothetical protein